MISRGEISTLCRRAENGPDAEHVYRDDAGVTWFRFIVDWSCDGRSFSTFIWAQDFADAQRRLHALRSSGQVIGQGMLERDCV